MVRQAYIQSPTVRSAVTTMLLVGFLVLALAGAWAHTQYSIAHLAEYKIDALTISIPDTWKMDEQEEESTQIDRMALFTDPEAPSRRILVMSMPTGPNMSMEKAYLRGVSLLMRERNPVIQSGEVQSATVAGRPARTFYHDSVTVEHYILRALVVTTDPIGKYWVICIDAALPQDMNEYQKTLNLFRQVINRVKWGPPAVDSDQTTPTDPV